MTHPGRWAAATLLACVLCLTGFTQAQAAPDPQPVGHLTTSAAASAPPSTSPAPKSSCNGKDDIDHWTQCIKCPSGNACAFMCCYQQANYFFRFYYGGTYRLNYWHGPEELFNHQTSGWTVKTYGEHGGLLHCYPPRSAYYTVDWDPVWSIKLSAQSC